MKFASSFIDHKTFVKFYDPVKRHRRIGTILPQTKKLALKGPPKEIGFTDDLKTYFMSIGW